MSDTLKTAVLRADRRRLRHDAVENAVSSARAVLRFDGLDQSEEARLVLWSVAGAARYFDTTEDEIVRAVRTGRVVWALLLDGDGYLDVQGMRDVSRFLRSRGRG